MRVSDHHPGVAERVGARDLRSSSFPAEVGRVTDTTNAIEALNGSCARRSRPQGSFPHDDAAASR